MGEEMGWPIFGVMDEGVANTYIGYLGLFYMKVANFYHLTKIFHRKFMVLYLVLYLRIALVNIYMYQ